MRAQNLPLELAFNPILPRLLGCTPVLGLLIFAVHCCLSCRPRGGIRIDSLCIIFRLLVTHRVLRQTALRHVPFTTLKVLDTLDLRVLTLLTCNVLQLVAIRTMS